MTDEQLPNLDPDQVECPVPSCLAEIGHPCTTPTGAKSRTVHMPRRRAAAAGQLHRRAPRAQRGSSNPGTSSLTPSARSKGGKVTAQNRARRKAEAAAAAEAEVERLELEAITREAETLAADSVRYTRDRLLVKRQTLDAAQLAADRLVEGLRHMRRPKGFDEDGVALTKPVEVYRTVRGKKVRERDEQGNPVTEDVLDLVGHYRISDLEGLAKVATATLNAIRLEEGKPTGILEQQGATQGAQLLGELGIAELLKVAGEILPGEGGGQP